MLSSFSQALSRAAATAKWAAGMCDNFVANMYGLSASGYNTAAEHWNSIPDQYKHPGDGNPPAGALVFWGGGQGHVAISDGNGYVYSTDQPSQGNVGHVPLSAITQGWGKPYLGWSDPYFSGQAVGVGSVGNGASQFSAVYSGAVQADSGIPPIFGLLGVQPPSKDHIQRLGLILLGGAILVIGIINFTKGGQKLKIKVRQGGGKNAPNTPNEEGQESNG